MSISGGVSRIAHHTETRHDPQWSEKNIQKALYILKHLISRQNAGKPVSLNSTIIRPAADRIKAFCKYHKPLNGVY